MPTKSRRAGGSKVLSKAGSFLAGKPWTKPQRPRFTDQTELRGTTVNQKLENYFTQVRGEFDVQSIEFVGTNQRFGIGGMGNPNINLNSPQNQGKQGSIGSPAGRISKFNSRMASPLIVTEKPEIRLPLSELIKRKVGNKGGEVDEKRIRAIILAAEKVAQRVGIEIEMPSAAYVPNPWQTTDQSDPARLTLEKAWQEDDVDLKEKILKMAKDEEVAHEIEAHNNSIVKGFNEWIRKKALQMEEIRDGVKNTKLPPQIPNINIFREEENMFPLDFNMDMYNFNVQSRDNETKNISDNVKTKMLLPLKSCQTRLEEVRVIIGLKRKELRMLDKQLHDAIRDVQEKSSSSQNSDSDSSHKNSTEPDHVALSQALISTCKDQIRTLKDEAEWSKDSIKKMKIGIIDMMKGWAHWEESAPENIFEFKLNDQ